MDERKDKILKRLIEVSNKKRRVTYFANTLIALFILLVMPLSCAINYGYSEYELKTGLPPIVLVFLVYAIKVVVVEYLNGRAESLQKDLDNLYDQENKTV